MLERKENEHGPVYEHNIRITYVCGEVMGLSISIVY